jgi:hypothetical protein
MITTTSVCWTISNQTSCIMSNGRIIKSGRPRAGAVENSGYARLLAEDSNKPATATQTGDRHFAFGSGDAAGAGVTS